MKLLTIVIPCYNVEQYLAECLDSILDSKYNDVLEVLAINDGSKDGTLALAREYEARFPEILRVIDKPNGGWGTVINMAIAEARGRYFKILDSDDWFDISEFAQLIASLQCCDTDIFISNFTEYYSDEIIEGERYNANLCGYSMQLDTFLERTGKVSLFPMTNITVKIDVLRNAKIVLPKRYYGDICFYVYVHAFSNSVYVTNLNVYQYRKLEGQSTSVEGYVRNFYDYIEVNRRMISFFSENKMSKSVRTLIKSNLMNNIGFAYKLLMSKEYCGELDSSREVLRDFDKYLKHTSPDLYRATFKVTNKHIPYVLIWRLFNINLFKLR